MAEEANEETGETESGRQRTPLTMLAPAAVLTALGLAAGVLAIVPRFGAAIESAAVLFQDQSAYTATVLHGVHVPHPAALHPAVPPDVTVSSVVVAVCAALGSVLLALVALYWRRLPVLRRGYEPGVGLIVFTRRVQSSVINDYVTWIVTGLACLGGVLALIVR